ncbi:MAG: SGNH/GDSL hydrolase family protein [Lachnospiraceae bacterium]|nr:SGNH/GDSL hydrolase family protein [Lachnospiraceae bacterium]
MAKKYLTSKMIGRSIAYEGSPEALVSLMKRAKKGEKLTLCFLGGSITQGSLSSTPETCYAYLVYSWFVQRFPKAKFTYVNAGIGGTSSQFGITRLAENVTPYKPDFCMVEFSVNDPANPLFKETYEGLIRRLRRLPGSPALLIMNNLFYDTGVNSQDEHDEIGEAYDITCISVRDAVRPEIEAGRIKREELSPDGLHPNDAGHAVLAGLVTDHLEKLCAEYVEGKAKPAAPVVTIDPVTVNAMEKLKRTQYRSKAVECKGFKPDYSKKKDLHDLFKHGWKAWNKGDSITFTFTGSELALQYRKTIHRPTPVAEAIIDGDTAHPVLLDGNFDQDWGDHLYIGTLMYHGERIETALADTGRVQFAKPTKAEAAAEAKLAAISQKQPEKKKHTVTIRIIETHKDDKVPFYLVSFITA